MTHVKNEKYWIVCFISLLLFGCSSSSNNNTIETDEFNSLIGLWTEKQDIDSPTQYESYIEFTKLDNQIAYNYYLLSELEDNCYTKELNVIELVESGTYKHVNEDQGGTFIVDSDNSELIISFQIDDNNSISTEMILVENLDPKDIQICSE